MFFGKNLRLIHTAEAMGEDLALAFTKVSEFSAMSNQRVLRWFLANSMVIHHESYDLAKKLQH